MQLRHARAIVTGGASGLGAATARFFAGAGARVAIFDRAQDGRDVAGELGPAGMFHEVDVTQEAGVAAAVAATVERFGAIDVVVNCAGIVHAATTLGKDGPHPLDAYRTVIDVNLAGTFNVMRLAAAAMRDNAAGPDGERGVIVNTASIAAFDGQRGQAAYAASKGGIVAMTLPAARDLARFGIRVNTIAPGLFLTPLLESLDADVRADLARDVVFPRRLGRPSDFARLAANVVENPYLNGETIRLDGGLRLP